ncbi:hypothetical protein Tco_0028800 [Tanacetum coccineum]
MPTDPQHTPTITQPSTSKPKRTQKPRKPKKKNTKVPQPSGSTDNVVDEAVNEEIDGSLVRAATTASCLEAEQYSGNILKTRSKAIPIEASSLGTTSGGGRRRQDTMGDTIAQTRFENVSKTSNDSLLAGVNTPRSDEDRLKLNELMEICIKLQQRVLGLENTKTAQAHDIDADERITLVNETTENQGRFTDEDMFGVNDLNGDEVIINNVDVVKTTKETVNVAVTTIHVSTASTIPVIVAIITDVEITLAQTLAELKTAKPKAKGIVMQEPGKSTTIKPQQQHSKDKGKAIMEELEKPLKKKDQIRFDEEVALKLQAQMQA